MGDDDRIVMVWNCQMQQHFETSTKLSDRVVLEKLADGKNVPEEEINLLLDLLGPEVRVDPDIANVNFLKRGSDELTWSFCSICSQVEVEVVLHNLELLGVDLDQAWVVEAENTGRVIMMLLKTLYSWMNMINNSLDSPN